MAKSKDQKKKKGPKGKRARAKAQLDRQWGERALATTTTTRRGKSRLLPLPEQPPDESLRDQQGNFASSCPRGMEEDGDHYDQRYGNEDSDDETSSRSSSFHGDAAEQENDDGQGALTSLLDSIRQRKRSHQHSSSAAATRKTQNRHDDDADSSDTSMEEEEEENEQTSSGSGGHLAPPHDAVYRYSLSDLAVAQQQLPECWNNVFGQRFDRAPAKLLLPEAEAVAFDGTSNEEDVEEKQRARLEEHLLKIQETTTWPFPENGDSSSVMMDIQAPKNLASILGPPRASDAAQPINGNCWNEWTRAALGSTRPQLLLKQWARSDDDEIRNRSYDDKESASSSVLRMTPLQTVLYPVLSQYTDLLLTTRATTTRTGSRPERQDEERCVVLHMLHHVLTSRTRIAQHNQKIKKIEEKGQESFGATAATSTAKLNDDVDHADDRFRDQGYTRPTVLVLLPTRGTCHAFVETMLSLLNADFASDASSTMSRKGAVENWDRFQAEYGPPPGQAESPDSAAQAREAERRRQRVLEQKGAEWLDLFGDHVNSDDDFKIGFSLNPNRKFGKNKKTKTQQGGEPDKQSHACSVRLYTDFYNSDIILASPLSLKMLLAEQNNDEEDDSFTSSDFLSSIEICCVHRADVLLMQNWDHVNSVLDLLNQQPRNLNDTDFGRVRQYLLAGQAQYWRQLIVLSKFSDPAIMSTFKCFAKSIAGLVRIRQRVAVDQASISQVLLPTRQVFQRVPTGSFRTAREDCLKYFCDKVLPSLLGRNRGGQPQKQTLIFIPSYFDFVAVRNVLLSKQQNDPPVEFVSVTEYSRVSETSRARARFLQGRKPLMLYTGRAHFFLRHAIKGIRHVIIFGLPEYADMYSFHVNSLNKGLQPQPSSDDNDNLRGGHDALASDASCLALFTKYDSHALERIVGSSNCSRMVTSDKSTFLF